MGVLSRVKPSIRAGLSANAVRLLTGEPEPVAPVYMTKTVQSEPAHHQKSAQAQLNRRLNDRVRKRTAKRRG